MKKGIMFIMISMSVKLYAQNLDSLLGTYNEKVPQEKLHVQFDNSMYTPGQTIWYKAYLVKDFERSDLSKTLYINWVDEAGKLINRTIAPVINGTASGDFAVPQTYSGTRIQVMAYTRWMLNFDSSLLFHQILSVVQPQLVVGNQTAAAPVTNLQFYPEGGDMVESVAGSIAFKAISSAAMPVNVSGIIVNKSKQVITTFTTEHDGMGKVLFTPLPGEEYVAEWKDPQGNLRNSPLPVARKTGIVLTVKDATAIPMFVIERPAMADDRFKKITIVGTMGQQVVFKAKASLTDKVKISSRLPANKFSSGVLQLTVFDDHMQPLAERVLFVNNEEYRLSAEVYTDTLDLSKRGKNVYQIELNDTIPASLSLAITEGESNCDSSKNIISQLLLSSDIKGYVHNPAYYFSIPGDSVANQLDLVMLTNGWRRFVWNDVLTGKIPQLPYSYDSSYLSLAGKIDRLSDGKIKKADLVNLMLVAKDSSKQFVFTPLQPDGSFRENNLVLFDTTKVYYTLNNTDIPGRSHVTISNSFLPIDTVRHTRFLKKSLPDTTGTAHTLIVLRGQKRLDSLMRLTTLKEVVVETVVKKRTRLQEMNDKYATGVFNGSRSHDFNTAEDFTARAHQTVFTYLQSKVAGLSIINPDGIEPPPVVLRRTMPVAFFLNEVPADVYTLVSLPMTAIAYIKVIDPGFVGAAGAAPGGAIAVYTMRGNDVKITTPGLDFTLLPGYTPFKEFYAPNYAETQMNFSQADLRRTLYWSPNLITDGTQKKISISFYNNDISHSLQLVLEGMAMDGRLIHVSKLLK